MSVDEFLDTPRACAGVMGWPRRCRVTRARVRAVWGAHHATIGFLDIPRMRTGVMEWPVRPVYVHLTGVCAGVMGWLEEGDNEAWSSYGMGALSWAMEVWTALTEKNVAEKEEPSAPLRSSLPIEGRRSVRSARVPQTRRHVGEAMPNARWTIDRSSNGRRARAAPRSRPARRGDPMEQAMTKRTSLLAFSANPTQIQTLAGRSCPPTARVRHGVAIRPDMDARSCASRRRDSHPRDRAADAAVKDAHRRPARRHAPTAAWTGYEHPHRREIHRPDDPPRYDDHHGPSSAARGRGCVEKTTGRFPFYGGNEQTTSTTSDPPPALSPTLKGVPFA